MLGRGSGGYEVATESTVLYVAHLVEEDADEARRTGWPTDTEE